MADEKFINIKTEMSDENIFYDSEIKEDTTEDIPKWDIMRDEENDSAFIWESELDEVLKNPENMKRLVITRGRPDLFGLTFRLTSKKVSVWWQILFIDKIMLQIIESADSSLNSQEDFMMNNFTKISDHYCDSFRGDKTDEEFNLILRIGKQFTFDYSETGFFNFYKNAEWLEVNRPKIQDNPEVTVDGETYKATEFYDKFQTVLMSRLNTFLVDVADKPLYEEVKVEWPVQCDESNDTQSFYKCSLDDFERIVFDRHPKMKLSPLFVRKLFEDMSVSPESDDVLPNDPPVLCMKPIKTTTLLSKI